METDDPDLVEAGPWFEWHHDRWVAPPGARVLARTAAAEQAFVIGRSLAVQFHPELTPGMLRGWLANGGATYLEAHGIDAGAGPGRDRRAGSGRRAGGPAGSWTASSTGWRSATPDVAPDLTTAGPAGRDS